MTETFTLPDSNKRRLVALWFFMVQFPDSPDRTELLCAVESALAGETRPPARLLALAHGLPPAPAELLGISWERCTNLSQQTQTIPNHPDLEKVVG